MTFWLFIIAVVVLSFPFYASNFGKYSVSIAFTLGYFGHFFGLNSFWILVFSTIVFFVPEEKKVFFSFFFSSIFFSSIRLLSLD